MATSCPAATPAAPSLRKPTPSSLWHNITPAEWPSIYVRGTGAGPWRVYRISITAAACARPWRAADASGHVLRDALSNRVRCFATHVDAMLAANAGIIAANHGRVTQ